MSDESSQSSSIASEVPPIRPNYYEGRVVDLAAFESEQQYLIGQRRQLNAALFSPGVVDGLVVTMLDQQRLAVSPGMALDGSGREIVLERQTIQEIGVLARGTYRLEIRYDEALTRFTGPAFSPVSGTQMLSTGSSPATGYQTLTQMPILSFQPGDQHRGDGVVLALVSIDDQGRLFKVETGSPRFGRVHAGVRCGAITFSLPSDRPDLWPKIEMVKFDDQDLTDTMRFATEELNVAGPLALRGPLLVNGDRARALLTVTGNQSHDQGTMTTVGTSVHANALQFDPTLAVGDTLVADVPGSGTQMRTVTRVIDKDYVVIDTPFSPANNSQLKRVSSGPIASFSSFEGQNLVEVLDDGSVNLGLSPTSRSGFTLNISSSGNVGIGLPADKNRLEVGGSVIASSFIGNGSQLTGIQGLWTAGDQGKTITYQKGNVGIGTTTPRSTLEVIAPSSATGPGTLVSNDTKVTGTSTQFSSTALVGDFLIPLDQNGTPQLNLAALVTQIDSNTQLETATAFNPPLAQARYQFQPPLARFSYKDAPAHTPPVLVVGPGNQVGVNLALPAHTLDVGGSIHATQIVIGQTPQGNLPQQDNPANAAASSTAGSATTDLLQVAQTLTVGAAPSDFVISYLSTPTALTQITGNSATASASISAASDAIQLLADGSAIAPLAIASTQFTFSSGTNQLTLANAQAQGASLIAASGLFVAGTSGSGVSADGTLFSPSISADSLQLGPDPAGLTVVGQTIDAGTILLSNGSFQTTSSLSVARQTNLMQPWIAITSFSTNLVSTTDGLLTGFYLGTLKIGQNTYNLADTYDADYKTTIFWIPVGGGSVSGSNPVPFTFPIPKNTSFNLTPLKGAPSGLWAYFIPLGDASAIPQPAS